MTAKPDGLQCAEFPRLEVFPFDQSLEFFELRDNFFLRLVDEDSVVRIARFIAISE